MSTVEKVVITCSMKPKGFVKYYSFRKKRKMNIFMNVLMQLHIARRIYGLIFGEAPGAIDRNQRVYSAKFLAATMGTYNADNVKFVGEYDHPAETEIKI